MTLQVEVVTTREQAEAVYPLVERMIAEMGYAWAVPPSREDFVASIGKHDDMTALFIAKDGDAVVGTTRLSGFYNTYEAGISGYYQAMYVVPEARKNGVAKALFEAVKAETKSRGWRGLMWFVSDHNPKAQTFFSKETGKPVPSEMYHYYWMDKDAL